jgi:hypothetical protein
MFVARVSRKSLVGGIILSAAALEDFLKIL